jgi:hypothetical protein
MIDLMKPKMRAHFAQQRALKHAQQQIKRRGFAAKLRGMVKLRLGSTAKDVAAQLAQDPPNTGPPLFEHPCLIGTFHKTGTMLMMHVLQELASAGGAKFWNIGLEPTPSTPWDIGFHWWSDFSDAGIQPQDYPTVIILRDPRDVIVSGMRFHCRGKEPWLCLPDEALGGQTYQQALLAFDDDEQRFLFELQHQAGATIADMLAVKQSHAHRDTLFLTLEGLMSDRTFAPYIQLFSHLGLTEDYLPLVHTIARRHSVFDPDFKRTDHITSGRPAAWRDALSPRVLQALDDRFPGCVAALGYAP